MDREYHEHHRLVRGRFCTLRLRDSGGSFQRDDRYPATRIVLSHSGQRVHRISGLPTPSTPYSLASPLRVYRLFSLLVQRLNRPSLSNIVDRIPTVRSHSRSLPSTLLVVIVPKLSHSLHFPLFSLFVPSFHLQPVFPVFFPVSVGFPELPVGLKCPRFFLAFLFLFLFFSFSLFSSPLFPFVQHFPPASACQIHPPAYAPANRNPLAKSATRFCRLDKDKGTRIKTMFAWN